MKVLAALSGGVDSTVAAALAAREGHEVIGITLGLWGGARVGRSCSTADGAAAQAAANDIGIEHRYVDFTEDFTQRVIKPFVAAAREGVTTNPCLSCNSSFKVDALFDLAQRWNCDAVVTGHHANVVNTDQGYRLARSVDLQKDQSYVLHMVPPRYLEQLMLPLGEMTKDQVRAIANEFGFSVASTPDSMDLCFSPKDIIGETTQVPVRTTEGRHMGSTDLELVTIGQRRKLPTAGLPQPHYVTQITSTEVVVGPSPALNCTVTEVSDLTWFDEPGEVLVQASAHGTPRPAKVTSSVCWDTPTRRPAPGQGLVFYRTHQGTDVVVGFATAKGSS